MDEIWTTAGDRELEVNEDDIKELIMEHELTSEELQEILNEEHQETHRNMSPSVQEEDERGSMPTSAIKDLLKKWEDVRAMILEWHPYQADVSSSVQSVPEPDEIGNVIEEVLDHARQINVKVDSDDVQELLDSSNQDLTMDALIKMHEQDIEELDLVQSEDRRAVGNLREVLNLNETMCDGALPSFSY
ncbi:uncharacterized protein TNCV_2554221 [Trichonephila clavipes]|nr:uncharacterized protein TNCV_2554221 [Trichonephila clavipes]